MNVRPPSPAAQAVLDAAYALPLKNGQPSIAAALRVVANQFREAYANEEYMDSPDDYLDDIANELESQT